MLTPSAQAVIRSQGYSGHHDTRLSSIVEGEPFLQEGLLHYFDGRKLLICGYALDRREDDLLDRVRRVARDFLRRYPVEVVWYCGPLRTSLSSVCPSRFRPLGMARPLCTDSELALDSTVPLRSRRLRQWLRSAGPLAFSLRRRRFPEFAFQAAHYALLDRFFSSREMSAYLHDLAFKIPVLASVDAVEWFEAWQGKRLAGIAAVADAFNDMDVAVLLVAEPDLAGVSDFLYAAMRDSVRGRGKRLLNLGPSSSEGHYRFKQKWGAVPVAAPCWWQGWGAGELARRDYQSWPARLAQYGFALPQRSKPAAAASTSR
jgi:hypothetical protein